MDAQKSSLKNRLGAWAANLFYALIMLEGILMATPFGLLLYSFYDPFLGFARKSTLTAWVAAFFLPQSVYATTSPFVEFVRYGEYLFYIGLIGFLVFAAQVYWAKFTRKGMVSSFLYSHIRHPQYLFFMLSGFGLLFIWPRMMMLVLFLVMSVFYFYLARFEERRMLAQYPDYADYMRRTSMFLPGNPGGRLFAFVFGWIPNRRAAQFAAICVVVAMGLGAGVGLRNLTIANLSTAVLPERDILAISIYPHDEAYIRDAVSKTLASDEVTETLAAQGKVSFTAHILPGDYGMLGKFVSINEHHRSEILEYFANRTSMKGFLWGTDTDDVKMVFSKIDKPGQAFVPIDEILDMSAKMTPVLIADLNLATGTLTNFTRITTTYYGDVPQPMF